MDHARIALRQSIKAMAQHITGLRLSEAVLYRCKLDLPLRKTILRKGKLMLAKRIIAMYSVFTLLNSGFFGRAF